MAENMSSNSNLDDGFNLPTLDLTSIIADFRRFSRFFAAIFAVVFLAIVVPILVQAPKYTSSSAVMLDPRSNNSSPVQDVLSGLPADTAQLDTEVEVIKSNALATRIVASLKLDEDPEFNPYIKKKAGLFGGAKKEETLSPLQVQYRKQAVVNRVIAGLSVKRQGLTRIIVINYTSLSAEKSSKIANEWARLYLTQQIETKFEATKEANSWLNQRLGELKGQVQEADAAVQEYRIANNLMSAGGTNLTEQEISNYNQQVALAKATAAEAEARLSTAKNQMRNGSNGEDVGEALTSPVIQNLRSQRAQVSREVADLETKYGPLHPDIIKAKRQLEDIDGQIKSEVNRIISNLDAQAQVERKRLGSLSGSLYSARGTLAGNNKAMVRLNELEMDSESVRALYESYLNRFKQTSTEEGADKSDARIVSKATLPTNPSEPKIPLTLALGLVGGLGVAVGAVLVRRALDSGLITGADVESQLHQPYLTSIAALESTLEKGTKLVGTPQKFILQKPLSVFAEGFRSLRATLVYSRLDQEVKVIAVTSALPGEGKTTTSTCLAQTISSSGQSVVVVDCDLRRRSISDVLGREVEVGLLELLAGTARMEEVLIQDASGVYYIPLAKGSYTPKDVFGSTAMDRLLEMLKANFDVIVLDTAPVLPVVDTRILARKADITVMLARWRKTPRKAVLSALEMLQDAKVNIAGVALTQVDIKEQSKYGYGDSGYYYKSYKKYYTE